MLFLIAAVVVVEQALQDAYAEIKGSRAPGRILDVQRIMLVGFSNGGQMALRMAVEIPAVTALTKGVPWTVTAVAALSTSMGGWWPADGFDLRAPEYAWYPVASAVLIVHGTSDYNYGNSWNENGVGGDAAAAALQLEDPSQINLYVRADISALDGATNLAGKKEDLRSDTGTPAVADTTYGPTLLPSNGASLDAVSVEWIPYGDAVHFVVKTGMAHVMEDWFDAVFSFFEAWGEL